jgi:hypothetical protein
MSVRGLYLPTATCQCCSLIPAAWPRTLCVWRRRSSRTRCRAAPDRCHLKTAGQGAPDRDTARTSILPIEIWRWIMLRGAEPCDIYVMSSVARSLSVARRNSPSGARALRSLRPGPPPFPRRQHLQGAWSVWFLFAKKPSPVLLYRIIPRTMGSFCQNEAIAAEGAMHHVHTVREWRRRRVVGNGFQHTPGRKRAVFAM